MNHFLVEKGGSAREESRSSVQRVPEIEATSQYLYFVVSRAGAQQLLRASLDKVLEIAESVDDYQLDARTPDIDRPVLSPVSSDSGSHLRALRQRPRDRRREMTLRARRERFGDVEVDAAARVVTRAGELVRLAPLEFDLLLALLRRNGAAASRDELMAEVWGDAGETSSRTLDTHVFNLRRKLEEEPSRPKHILTVSKVGYRLRS